MLESYRDRFIRVLIFSATLEAMQTYEKFPNNGYKDDLDTYKMIFSI